MDTDNGVLDLEIVKQDPDSDDNDNKDSYYTIGSFFSTDNLFDKDNNDDN